MPRGRGILVATGGALGIVGLGNLALWASLHLEVDASPHQNLLGALDRLPLVAVGAGLVAFAIVRDPGPLSRWIGFVLLALLAVALLSASVLLGAAWPDAWRQASAEDGGARLGLLRVALQSLVYSGLFLYLAFAIWRSRPSAS